MKKYFYKEEHHDRIPRKIKKKNKHRILTEAFLTNDKDRENYKPITPEEPPVY